MSLIRLTLVVLWATLLAVGHCAVLEELHAQLHSQLPGVSVHSRKRIVGRFGRRSNSVKVRVAVPRVPFGHMYYALPPANAVQRTPVGSNLRGTSTAYESRYSKSPVKKLAPSPLLTPSVYDSAAIRPHKIEFPVIHTLEAARSFQLRAEKAFRSGRYQESVKLVQSAIRIDPHNGLLKLFSSQANFATSRYRIAATELEAATSQLRPEEWSFFGENFQKFYGRDDYVRQTRALVDHVERRPDDYQAKVLLGYHYGIAGHRTSATGLFHRAMQSNPQDSLAQRLLPVIGDPNLPMSRSGLVQAPSPESDSTWIRSHAWDSSRTPPKRIYLTSQFTPAPPATHHMQQPMSADELIEAPTDVIIPQLDGPSGTGGLQSVLEEF